MKRLRAVRPFLTIAAAAVLLAGPLAGCGKKSTPPPQVEPPRLDSTPAPAPQGRGKAELPGALAIMVENSPQAVPQAGLEKAELVYELESEGGITRFMAFFYQQKAERIGPVRSARMSFYQIATAYALPYAHAGGSNEVLLELEQRNRRLLNLDEINTCEECFWRSYDRKAPHNLYTSTDRLISRAEKVHFALQPLFRYEEGPAPENGTPATEIAFTWGKGSQQVSWKWNGTRYERLQAGQPHLMESGTQLAADNLILLFTKYAWDPKAQPNSGLNRITVVGNGSGYLLRGGMIYPLTWSKPSPAEHYRFLLTDGSLAKLAGGQTWIEVLKSKADVAGLPQ